ncbi:hypothetical protein EZI54_18180 [Marinobacter halodurans]|uniref:Outer membrane protein beta-barrel domain-containing protein n=1 Tax=Marinobacter halodurans TaxID=2528979 RepID=A0ABY1ZIN1_9GAMM|nr:hypothetical protein [Marinobacter halodurans]TBW50568.1 hypothetical protein EZI54_18180 [Marinobacter halodurans]
MLRQLLLCLSALMLSFQVQAQGGVHPFIGALFTESQVASGQTGVSDALYYTGLEIQLRKAWSFGVSAAANDNTNDFTPSVDLKIDGYLKYRLFERSFLTPYLAAGVSGVAAEKRDCGFHVREAGGGLYGYTRCENRAVWSAGGSYQAGIELGTFHSAVADLYWEQYFGSHDVRVNAVGINVGVFY